MPQSDRPLQKVTMNFYRSDVAELVHIFGPGWTTEVREIISKYLINRQYFGGRASEQRD